MTESYRGNRIFTSSTVALFVALLALFGALIMRAQHASLISLENRAQGRIGIAAEFLAAHASDVLEREKTLAERWLATPEVRRSRFEDMTHSLDLKAAVVLDEGGHALAVWPHNKDLLGANLSDEYAHLLEAVRGREAVSPVVPSAAEGIPIVAFATPFRTNQGPRVFSGAISVEDSPVGAAYLSRISPIKGSEVYLVDETGKLVAASMADVGETLRAEDPLLADHLDEQSVGKYSGDSRPERFFAKSDVKGTPWSLVMSVPTTSLYEPLGGPGRFISWGAFGAFAGVGLLAIFLLGRFRRQRSALAALNGDLKVRNEEIVRMASELRDLSLADPLTGIQNRRGFELLGGQQLRLAQRNDEPLVVMFVDVNNMKTINDRYGHSAGDEALSMVGHVLEEASRGSDVVGRIGGDEFALILNNTPSPDPVLLRIRGKLQANSKTSPCGPVTVSIGASTFNPQKPQSLAALLKSADEAMYVQKSEIKGEISEAVLLADSH